MKHCTYFRHSAAQARQREDQGIDIKQLSTETGTAPGSGAMPAASKIDEISTLVEQDAAASGA